VRQVGYLQEMNRDARSIEHKILQCNLDLLSYCNHVKRKKVRSYSLFNFLNPLVSCLLQYVHVFLNTTFSNTLTACLCTPLGREARLQSYIKQRVDLLFEYFSLWVFTHMVRYLPAE
jgi:hypothetical protein